MIKVSFRITPEARSLLRRQCSSSESGKLVPEVIWAQKDQPPYGGRWFIGYHDQEKWDDAPSEFKFVIDGERFLISFLHTDRLQIIDGAVLDVDSTGEAFEFKVA